MLAKTPPTASVAIILGLISLRRRCRSLTAISKIPPIMIPFRVGIGYDSHRFIAGRKLILAGVEVPFERGLDGHSDADVILHAISDAVCGACGLPDIGRLFPDTDPKWQGADSGLLLAQIVGKAHQAGWQIGNVDAVLIAQKPKIADYVPQMQTNVAKWLQIPTECVNIRGKTAENLGALGAGLGMACHAVCVAVRAPE